MTQIDPEQERQRLAEFYSQRSEGELSELARKGNELTDVAREMLRSELLKRGLYIGQTELEFPGAEKSAEFRELVTIRKFPNVIEGELAKGLLQAAGIESFLFDEHIANVYWTDVIGGIRLRVDAQNAELANRILQENATGEAALEEPRPPDDDSST